MLIGISGYAQSGKDTLCNILIHHGIIDTRYAFADPIKDTVNAMFGWDERHAFGDLKETMLDINCVTGMDSDSFLAKCEEYGLTKFGLNAIDIENVFCTEMLPYLNTKTGILTISPRICYQLFGTEVGRRRLHEDVWVLIAPTEKVAIPDVRFPNEAKWIADNGGYVFRVVKDDAKPIAPHESEKYIESLPCNTVFDNNGTLKELEDQVIKAFDLDPDVPRLYATENEISYTEADVLADRIASLKETVEHQCQPGNWNYDQYMHGFANGLILALAIMEGREYADMKDAPEEWMVDRHPELPGGFDALSMMTLGGVIEPMDEVTD